MDCKTPYGKVWNSDKEIKIDKLGYLIDNNVKTKSFWNAKISCSKKPLRMKVRNIAGDEIIVLLIDEKKPVQKVKKSISKKSAPAKKAKRK